MRTAKVRFQFAAQLRNLKEQQALRHVEQARFTLHTARALRGTSWRCQTRACSPCTLKRALPRTMRRLTEAMKRRCCSSLEAHLRGAHHVFPQLGVAVVREVVPECNR